MSDYNILTYPLPKKYKDLLESDSPKPKIKFVSDGLYALSTHEALLMGKFFLKSASAEKTANFQIRLWVKIGMADLISIRESIDEKPICNGVLANDLLNSEITEGHQLKLIFENTGEDIICPTLRVVDETTTLFDLMDKAYDQQGFLFLINQLAYRKI
jgi:hypothetical protein